MSRRRYSIDGLFAAVKECHFSEVFHSVQTPPASSFIKTKTHKITVMWHDWRGNDNTLLMQGTNLNEMVGMIIKMYNVAPRIKGLKI